MSRELKVSDDTANGTGNAQSKKIPAKRIAAKRTRADVASRAGNVNLTGGAKISAKDLKGHATQLAFEGNPARYLGLSKGRWPVRLSRLVEEGLSAKTAEYLAGNLEVPVAEFTARYIQIPKQTMARRKIKGKLNVAESDRVARFARLLKHTSDMMEGDHDAAIHWLKTPHILLEDQTPLEFARTESGVAEVLQLIGRIETGVYS